MTSERDDSDDDFTWPGLVERAMRAAGAGAPDTAADRRLLDVLRGAIACGCDTALLATTCAEARQYVAALLTRVTTGAPGDTASAALDGRLDGLRPARPVAAVRLQRSREMAPASAP
jgi:hypothetical protein